MNSMLFTLVPVFIGGCFLFVFGSIALTMFRTFRGTRNTVIDRIIEASQEANKQDNKQGMTVDNKNDYGCTHCGAAIEAGTEISPSGDFKCAYCQNWSNVK